MKNAQNKDQSSRLLMRTAPRELSKDELDAVAGGDKWGGGYKTSYDSGQACDAD
jgi:hypothetical protein